jgi:xylan 1,4-beta-xylosidase
MSSPSDMPSIWRAFSWAFEFEDQPYFAGFRVLATNGIDLPVFNLFRMFARMSGERLAVESSGSVPIDRILAGGVRERPDVSAWASLDDRRLCVLLWHYHDDDLPGPAADIRLTIENVPNGKTKPTIRRFAIDAEHSNAYTAWCRMREPQKPTAAQYAELQRRGQLTEVAPPELTQSDHSRLRISFNLPRQAVSLLEFEWSR